MKKSNFQDHVGQLAMIIVVIAIIGNAFLVVRYIHAHGDVAESRDKLEASNLELRKLSSETQLELEVTQAEIELEKEQRRFSEKVSGPNIIKDFVSQSEQSGLEILDIRTSRDQPLKVGDHKYIPMVLLAEVEGPYEGFQKLIRKLEAGSIRSSKIDEININKIITEEITPSREQHSVVARIQLSIYSRE